MALLWYTPGPASQGRELDIIRAGATGVRLTFSYSTPDYQAERALLHRRLAQRHGAAFTIVADLAGEKYRLGRFLGAASVQVSADDQFRLIAGDHSDPATERLLTVTSGTFLAGLERGDLITAGDGSTVFEVTGVGEAEARLVVTADGTINQSRGLTVQGANFRPRCLTDKDLSDLEFVARSGCFDAVALSFVAEALDVRRARGILTSGERPMEIIAKIETLAGVEHVTEITQEADMVMAARGDLALAMPWVELPDAVWRVEAAAQQTGTPWVLATQIVEGLERFVMPTRAEICDLAGWLVRGCGGVLVSYETAFGARPVEAVRATRALLDRWSVGPTRP